jgi:hypothetical protein
MLCGSEQQPQRQFVKIRNAYGWLDTICQSQAFQVEIVRCLSAAYCSSVQPDMGCAVASESAGFDRLSFVILDWEEVLHL